MSKPDIIRPNAPTPYHSPTTSETPSPTNSQSHPLLYPSPAPQVQAPLTPPQSNTPPDAVRLARKGKQKKERTLPAQQQPSRPRKQQQQLPKACPSCRNRATERFDELDHMLCWGCGCEWCLRCEVAPWREGHECHLRMGGMPREDAERRRGDMLRGGGW